MSTVINQYKSAGNNTMDSYQTFLKWSEHHDNRSNVSDFCHGIHGYHVHCKVMVIILLLLIVVVGGLGVMCSPPNPRFAGSNPAEVDGFFQDVKLLSTSPSGGILSRRSRV